MQVRKLNSDRVAAPIGGYAQVCEVSGAQRMVFVSGQIPQPLTGEVPPDFDAQCRLTWRNVEAQLATVDMTLANLVKVRHFCRIASTVFPTAPSVPKCSATTSRR